MTPAVPKLGADHAIVAALLLFATAVWMPPITLQRPVFTYMVTFDITQSMDVQDVDIDGTPSSRLELARVAMQRALRKLPCGSRVGWSVFSDYRALPLILPVEVCSHYEPLLASLDAIDGRMRWANASNIGTGAAWMLRSAKGMDGNVNVVFITDGHESPPLRGNDMPPMAGLSPGEIGGWLVGVGGALPARIPKSDAEGRPVGYWQADDVVQSPDGRSHEHLSELRESHLRALSNAMGLGYARLGDADALATAMTDRRLASTAPVATDFRWAPALLALLLLAWRFMPGMTRRTPSTRR